MKNDIGQTRQIKQKGSAILLALVMILMILPLAIGLLNLNVMSGKNTVISEDSQVNDAVAQAGINDALARYKFRHNFLVTGGYYCVDVDENKEYLDKFNSVPNIIPINKRNHRFYEVYREENDKVIITSYYAGVKHSYEITLATEVVEPINAVFPGGSNAEYFDDATKTLYSCDKNGILRIYDLTIKTYPELKAQIGIGTKPDDSGRYSVLADMIVSGDYLYAVVQWSSDPLTIGAQGTLFVINVQNKTSPEVVTQLSLPNSGNGHPFLDDVGKLMAINGDTLYIGGYYKLYDSSPPTYQDELMIVNIGDEEDPTIGRYFDVGDPYDTGLGLQMRSIRYNDPYLYIAYNGSLEVYNIPANYDSINPTKVETVGAGKEIQDVVFKGNYAYLATHENGLMVMRNSNRTIIPGQSICAGEKTNFSKLTLSGNKIYAVNTNPERYGLYEIDISTADWPSYPGCTSGGNANLPDLTQTNLAMGSQDNLLVKVFVDTNLSGEVKYLIGIHTADTFAVYDATTHKRLALAPVIGKVYDFKVGVTTEPQKLLGAYDDSKLVYAISSTGIQILDTSQSQSNPPVVANFPLEWQLGDKKPGGTNACVIADTSLCGKIPNPANSENQYKIAVNKIYDNVNEKWKYNIFVYATFKKSDGINWQSKLWQYQVNLPIVGKYTTAIKFVGTQVISGIDSNDDIMATDMIIKHDKLYIDLNGILAVMDVSLPAITLEKLIKIGGSSLLIGSYEWSRRIAVSDDINNYNVYMIDFTGGTTPNPEVSGTAVVIVNLDSIPLYATNGVTDCFSTPAKRALCLNEFHVSFANGIAVDDRYIYVSQEADPELNGSTRRLSIYDINDPYNKKYSEMYDSEYSGSYGIELDGSKIYLSVSEGGSSSPCNKLVKKDVSTDSDGVVTVIDKLVCTSEGLGVLDEIGSYIHVISTEEGDLVVMGGGDKGRVPGKLVFWNSEVTTAPAGSGGYSIKKLY